MLEGTKTLLMGKNGTKGLIQRSGILTALITTIFVIIEGYTTGSILAEVASQKTTLMPMWTAALTVLIGNPSKKATP